jgi:formylglycine-generating enzyme required for sulfatase activity
LAERSTLWSTKPENRFLPSALEWANIRMLTRKKDWTDSQRGMMKRATRFHGLKALWLSAIAAVLVAVGLDVQNRVVEIERATSAWGLVQQIESADTAKVTSIIRYIKRADRRWTDPELRRIVANAGENSKEKLHASLALLPVEPGQVQYLFQRLLASNPHELLVIREALDGHRAELVERLWAILENAEVHPDQRFAAACALAGYASGGNEERWLSASGFITGRLLARVIKNPSDYAPLLEALRPIRGRLLGPLSATLRGEDHHETERSFATSILTDYASDQPSLLVDLLMDAAPEAYSELLPIVREKHVETLPLLRAEIGKEATREWNESSGDASWKELDAKAKNSIESACGIVGDRFAFCQTMLLDDFIAIAEGLRKSGYRPSRFRPYADKPVVRVAAVWVQDGRKWRIAHDQTKEQVSRQTELDRTDGFVAVDAAGYVRTGSDGKPTDRYAIVWVEKARADDDSQVVAPFSASELATVQYKFRNARMAPIALNSFRGADGRTSYCGVWQKAATNDLGIYRRDLREITCPDELADRDGRILVDLGVCVPDAPSTTSEWSSATLNAAEAGRKENLDEPNARFESKARYRDDSYPAVWWGNVVGVEAIPIFGLDPEKQLERCRELASKGYRIVSLSVEGTAFDSPPDTASVWHRPVVSEQAKNRKAHRQARAAVALILMGKAQEVWPLLRHSADPSVRSCIVNWLSRSGVDSKIIADELNRVSGHGSPAARRVESPAASADLPATSPQPRSMDTILFHPETSIRRALILALGTYRLDALPSISRDRLIAKLLALYASDPDSGIHGAVEWALRQWNQEANLEAADAKLIKLQDPGGRRWKVNSLGQTFALIHGPVEFHMGSPASEPGRSDGFELSHRRLIPRRFAIAAKEVTIADFRDFVKENPWVELRRSRSEPDLKAPVDHVSWDLAAAYCNWLSRRENLPECYEPNPQGRFEHEMKIRPDALQRTGYRLPTEAEWEYACRCGSATSRYFGVGTDLLERYGWYLATSQDHAWPCGGLLPNDLGLFDTLGNVYEWCHDQPLLYRPNKDALIIDGLDIRAHVNANRLLRGGSFNLHAKYIRSAGRGFSPPTTYIVYFGFRLARTCD